MKSSPCFMINTLCFVVISVATTTAFLYHPFPSSSLSSSLSATKRTTAKAGGDRPRRGSFLLAELHENNEEEQPSYPDLLTVQEAPSLEVIQQEGEDDITNGANTSTNGVVVSQPDENEDDVVTMTPEEEEQNKMDIEHMEKAIELARSVGGERGKNSPFPGPIAGAVIASKDGTILGEGRSDYKMDCIRQAFQSAGVEATPLKEWCVKFPPGALREALRDATLYVTLEPLSERHTQNYGQEALPPITQLIELSGVKRVMIGCSHPVPEYSTMGASALHKVAGMSVKMGSVLQEECERLIRNYSDLANRKLQRMARKQFEQFRRPLGLLHCSVVDSDDREAFARQGNAFGKISAGKNLSYREFGTYGIAPPPQFVWAQDQDEDEDDESYDYETEVDDFFSLDFEDEDYQGGITKNPMTPWYEQMDAVVCTLPKEGNGPSNDDSFAARLNGLKWLSTQGKTLPSAVERILVMDATDLKDLPLSNDNPHLPPSVDIEGFWSGKDRKPTRVLLRRGESVQAKATAVRVAEAAQAAVRAADAAVEAIETGDAIRAAETAVECQQAALDATKKIQDELEEYQKYKRKLSDLGVIVETIQGGEPIDVMKHLGERNGYRAVVWRAGCWGERGVKSIMAGAFQFVSAHLAVDAKGGVFWQQMLAENAVQAACGPEQKVKIFADQDDLSLEYCDQEDEDSDCVLTVDGKPIRHVRLDCRIALVDNERPREIIPPKQRRLDQKLLSEEAPWFF